MTLLLFGKQTQISEAKHLIKVCFQWVFLVLRPVSHNKSQISVQVIHSFILRSVPSVQIGLRLFSVFADWTTTMTNIPICPGFLCMRAGVCVVSTGWSSRTHTRQVKPKSRRRGVNKWDLALIGLSRSLTTRRSCQRMPGLPVGTERSAPRRHAIAQREPGEENGSQCEAASLGGLGVQMKKAGFT